MSDSFRDRWDIWPQTVTCTRSPEPSSEASIKTWLMRWVPGLGDSTYPRGRDSSQWIMSREQVKFLKDYSGSGAENRLEEPKASWRIWGIMESVLRSGGLFWGLNISEEMRRLRAGVTCSLWFKWSHFLFWTLFSLTWTGAQYLFLATVQGHTFEKKTMSFSCIKGFRISMGISTKASWSFLLWALQIRISESMTDLGSAVTVPVCFKDRSIPRGHPAPERTTAPQIRVGSGPTACFSTKPQILTESMLKEPCQPKFKLSSKLALLLTGFLAWRHLGNGERGPAIAKKKKKKPYLKIPEHFLLF